MNSSSSSSNLLEKDAYFSPEILHHWQQILDLIIHLCHVPAALIMKINEDDIEVFSRSANFENPYELGAKEKLEGELYCEQVIASNKELLVPNALKDENWNNNPDIALNMISYLGLPLSWPSGKVFGTICILDRKENPYNDTIRSILKKFRDSVETSLVAVSLNEELRDKNQALEEMLDYKNEILSLVAHDLRSPLNVIESSVEIMEMVSSGSEFQSDSFSPRDMIRRSTETIRILLEDILEAEHLESGKVRLKKEQFDLLEILLATHENHLAGLKQKELSLNFNCHEPCIIRADKMRILQVYDNLISNAVKYSFLGKKITIKLNQIENNAVCLMVEDEGPGLTQKDLKNIFGKFQRLSARPTADESSNGLGLFIVKQIALLHGGSITAENRKNGGSRFTLLLPKI